MADHLLVLSSAKQQIIDEDHQSLFKKFVDDEKCDDETCAIHHQIVNSSNKNEPQLLIKKRNSDFINLNLTDSHFDYKSGAIYEGKAVDNQKCGQGTFIWPNGDKYIGEFKLNSRNGFGLQYWIDGSSYEGQFKKDHRNGYGTHKWANGDTYEGDWCMDHRHGHGKYKWENSNMYDGMFFMNCREGYGTLMYSSGDLFVGLYKKDDRFGPGVLKYPNNNEDVGYWIGDKLIRLLIDVNVNFILQDSTDSIDNQIELCSWFDRENLLYETLNPQNIFLNRLHSSSKSKRFIKNDPYVDKVLEQKVHIYSEYLKAFEKFLKVNIQTPKKSKPEQQKEQELNEQYESYRKNYLITIDNITPSLMELFKYFRRFQMFHPYLKQNLNFDIEGFEKCDREKFASPGLLETSSIELLNACNERNLNKVKSLKNYVNFDVCDNRGYSPLIISVLKCDTQIINYLLDNGANINHLLDNGLSALMICMIRYYTSDKFLPNTALKHQDLPLTRKINEKSIVVPGADELANVENESKTEIEVHTLPGESTKLSEFGSNSSLIRFKLELDENLQEIYVGLKSKNQRVDSFSSKDGHLLKRTNQLQFLNEIEVIIELLLRRGANPSLSDIPYPALCFAVAAGDIKIVRLLLEKGAECNKKMPKKYSSLTPLCLACGVLGETGPELVKLLLDSLADPNQSADLNDEYLSMCETGWQNETVSNEIKDLCVGRTPLHIACARNDIYAAKIIKLLLDHSADPNLICNGQSPLTLAIASGNKEAVDLLLKSNKCDVNLPLTNGVGSALCVASSTLYEHNWSPHERIKLIEKLLHYGADILQPIVFGPRRYVGSVVDYAYYMYNSDTRLAHTPYHSLTINERNTHNARKNLLDHLGTRFREKSLEKAHLLANGLDYHPSNKKTWGPAVRSQKYDEDLDILPKDKRLPKWCYYCGRSVGVKLMPCSRCKKICYCSNNCKQRAWNEFHKNECVLADSHHLKQSEMMNEEKENPPGFENVATVRIQRRPMYVKEILRDTFYSENKMLYKQHSKEMHSKRFSYNLLSNMYQNKKEVHEKQSKTSEEEQN